MSQRAPSHVDSRPSLRGTTRGPGNAQGHAMANACRWHGYLASVSSLDIRLISLNSMILGGLPMRLRRG